MKIKNGKSSHRNLTNPKGRHFVQYVLETIWAGLAGAAVGYWQP